ncbi:MAG TPA: STAS domain-containing protein [Gaiellales bacterium]|jgi:anti-sigma B factor antagonist|nr:STAS domain-containing protein [Gaiellales bacterium]
MAADDLNDPEDLELEDPELLPNGFAQPGVTRVSEVAGIPVISLIGEHDLSTRTHLRLELDRLCERGSPVIVDLAAADFIDSTVLQTLISVGRLESPGSSPALVIVAAPATPPDRLLRLVNMSAVIPTFESRDQAVAFLGR